MALRNCTRSGCKDVFRAFLIKGAYLDGELQIPYIKPELEIPKKLISFSKSISSNEYDNWVHFYEDDANFERIWNNPKKYFPILKRFQGVITPDFSLYRDMPLAMQQWNLFRGRAIGYWLQSNGLKVLPNIRYSDERTYKPCCAGVDKGAVIAIGSHGCIKCKDDRQYFVKGLNYIVKTLEPSTILIYGSAPNSIFKQYSDSGISIIQYESEYSLSRKAVED